MTSVLSLRMRRLSNKPTRTAPFIRLLVALVSGILVQHYTDFRPSVISWLSVAGVPPLLLFILLKPSFRYRLRWLPAIGLFLLLFSAGCWLVYARNLSHSADWIGKDLDNVSFVEVTVGDAPIARPSSWKTIVDVNASRDNDHWRQSSGRLLLYFSKEGMPPGLKPGSRLIIRNRLVPVSSTGNPGAFDYKAYCASQGIFHQAYLKKNDFQIVSGQHGMTFALLLYEAREKTLAILRRFISGRVEAGVAEALLIGYRNDLDKDIVQAYSNTGVVHIIAISGLHLGMIYGLLVALFRPFRKWKWSLIVRPVSILLVLWTFTLLTGAAASILRSAVMFSFIIIGEVLNRKTKIYNTLAASAFCLLVYDPNLLWDVGFQLSYAAVVSIIIFQQPLYRKFFVQNRLLRMIWELNSITLAAQILTLPLILYYFHQFPNLFLFTNFIAVPLSGIILYLELILLLVCLAAPIAVPSGQLISFLISWMNNTIERTARIPFGITDNISFTFVQAVLLYALIITIACWIFQRRKQWLFYSMLLLSVYFGLTAQGRMISKKQHRLIVYNVPKKQAIDLMEGSRYQFISSNPPDAAAIQFHLRPGRIMHQVREGMLTHTLINGQFLQTAHKKVVLATAVPAIPPPQQKWRVDLLILGGNTRCDVASLAALFDCPQYVFDSSAPLWKIRQWKKQADSLHLRHHSVPELGAFEMAF